MMSRWLKERDQARDAGDRLAVAVAAYLEGEPVDLLAELDRYTVTGPSSILARVYRLKEQWKWLTLRKS